MRVLVKPSPTLSRMSGLRAPRQARGRASLDRLLDAAESLLAERGPQALSIAALSERSGLSNGAIYWRVDNLESLFVAVHDRLIQRLGAEHHVYHDSARWDGLDLETFVAQAVRLEAEIVQRHAGALRALALSTAIDPAANQRGTEAVRVTERAFVAHLRPCLTAHGCADPATVATAIFRIVFGALVNRVTWPEQQAQPDLPWPQFIADLCDMASALATRRATPHAKQTS